MKRKNSIFVMFFIIIVIIGWVVAYLVSPTLHRKYDAGYYGKFLYKEEEEQLKKIIP